MRLHSISKFAAVALCLFGVACGNKTFNRQPVFARDDQPRMIYIDDEVQKLKTTADIPSYRPLYVEVRTKTGMQKAGKLIRITDGEVIFAQQNYCKTGGDSLRYVESNVRVPKPEILIMKVW